MDRVVRQWIATIIRQNEPLIKMAVRQRAKFEGWLKFELAVMAEKNGAESVTVETTSQDSENNQQRADISFAYGGVRYDIELKTPNTNWRMTGVGNKGRPITKNISGIVEDARRLQKSSSNGLVAFVMFPIPPGGEQWVEYIHRIASELGLPITEKTNCDRVRISLGAPHEADLIICAFAISKNAV